MNWECHDNFLRLRVDVLTEDGGAIWTAKCHAFPELHAPGPSKGRAAIALLGLIAKQLEQEESDDV